MTAPILSSPDRTTAWIHPQAELVEHRAAGVRVLRSADLLELVEHRAADWQRLGLAPGSG